MTGARQVDDEHNRNVHRRQLRPTRSISLPEQAASSGSMSDGAVKHIQFFPETPAKAAKNASASIDAVCDSSSSDPFSGARKVEDKSRPEPDLWRVKIENAHLPLLRLGNLCKFPSKVNVRELVAPPCPPPPHSACHGKEQRLACRRVWQMPPPCPAWPGQLYEAALLRHARRSLAGDMARNLRPPPAINWVQQDRRQRFGYQQNVDTSSRGFLDDASYGLHGRFIRIV